MTEYIAGDKDSFVELYKNTYERVLRRLTRMFPSLAEAEDCTQDAFIKAFNHWGEWQPIGSAESWVMRIAINHSLSQIRKNKLRNHPSLDDEFANTRKLHIPVHDNPQDIAEDHELWVLVSKLSPKQKEAIYYRFFLGHSSRATAKILGEHERTIGSRLWAARNMLRPQLQESK